MKYIKLFESFNATKIQDICSKYDIENYTINSDGSIDVDGDVDLYSKRLTKIPLKFGNVSGYFYCNNNQLTTLEGAPQLVGAQFDCCNNQLITLKDSPKSVAGYFNCDNNQLTTLEGCPESVGRTFNVFYCEDNQLINFVGFPEEFDGDVYLGGNPVAEIYNLFDTVKCINLINEFDVIQGDKIIMDRLEMVYSQLGLDIPENIELKYYEII